MTIQEFLQVSGALFGWIYILYLLIFEGIFGTYTSREIKRSIERQTERLDKLIETLPQRSGRVR